ncbi:MAG: hypothetical protein D3908_07980, partial [Candidatus Electrothrix sp. AUS4]|nr:hypothetical protein [Candidatus Electrothrix sp. AUS4]
MKKQTIHTIALGSAALTAVTAGAWFMLSSDPSPKKPAVPTSPTSAIKENIPQQQTSQQTGAESSSPLSPDESPAVPDSTQDTLVNTTESLPENPVLDDNPDGEQEQELSAQDVAGNDAVISPAQTTQAPSNKEEQASSQGSSEFDLPLSSSLPDKEKTGSAVTMPSSSTPQGGENEQTQDIITSSQQQMINEGENERSEAPCNEVTPLLNHFLNKVEEKKYSKDTGASQPLQEHFNNLAAQLTKNPPVVTHETDDLYTVLTNTAHFFRILGKDNMQLLQKILQQESSDFENIAAEIYQTTTGGEICVSGKEKLEIPFAAAYEYAGFFLNTLGGRSYLFCRG